MTVWVTNRSGSEHSDSYSGVVYEWKAGTTVEMPDIAAQELFGYGIDDKVPFVVRNGWSVCQNDMKNALAKLAKFEVSTVPPVNPHLLSPVVERVPLPTSKRSAGTTPEIPDLQIVA